MSPDQLKELHKLSQLFEQGTASHNHIRQLNEILAQVNHQKVSEDISEEASSRESSKNIFK